MYTKVSTVCTCTKSKSAGSLNIVQTYSGKTCLGGLARGICYGPVSIYMSQVEFCQSGWICHHANNVIQYL